MELIIDNYDSFTFNLVQIVAQINPDVKVVRNDEISVAEILELNPEHIIISPGPGRPEDAGIIVPAIKACTGSIPILGVCLGHQAICQAFGADITYAKELMHGKSSVAMLGQCEIFEGLPQLMEVGRYHSLAADGETIPEVLHVCARTVDREIMAVNHVDFPVFGLQFHPESVLTPEGPTLIKNFLSL